ncbi:hypothetical protein [Kaarinaea lacus]
MEKLIKHSLVIAALMLAGCATAYYGHSKEEWRKLSEEEKQAARGKYDEIINFKYRQEHEDQFEERKQQAINRGLMHE